MWHIVAIVIVFILTLIGALCLYYYVSPLKSLYVAIPGILIIIIISIMRYHAHRISGKDTVNLPKPILPKPILPKPILPKPILPKLNLPNYGYISTYSLSDKPISNETPNEDIDDAVNDLVDDTIDVLLKEHMNYIDVFHTYKMLQKIKSTLKTLLDNRVDNVISEQDKATILQSSYIYNFTYNKLLDCIDDHNDTFGYGCKNFNRLETNYNIDQNIILPLHDNMNADEIELLNGAKEEYRLNLKDARIIIVENTITHDLLRSNITNINVQSIITIIANMLKYDVIIGSIFVDDVCKMIDILSEVIGTKEDSIKEGDAKKYNAKHYILEQIVNNLEIKNTK
jgi:hypothetical protein